MNIEACFYEIPVADRTRAAKFYAEIFGVKLEWQENGGYYMAFFPKMSGALVQGEGYMAGSNGCVFYLTCGDDLQLVLDKVEAAGGKVIYPKMKISDEYGYSSHIIDSEGNKLGLWSRN
ncbi:MAG: VOC family protein [Candidatus Cloacimonetes bacterium]|nr:VOC family protein [Candidatus Cloacimonadota bacterium]